MGKLGETAQGETDVGDTSGSGESPPPPPDQSETHAGGESQIQNDPAQTSDKVGDDADQDKSTNMKPESGKETNEEVKNSEETEDKGENKNTDGEPEPVNTESDCADKTGPPGDVIKEVDEEEIQNEAGQATETEPLNKTDGDEETGSHKAETYPAKRPWRARKCMFCGIVLLVLILCSAIAGILMHRFRGKTIVEFAFASYYGNHMVLQRAPLRAHVWGYGPRSHVKSKVTVILEGAGVKKTYSSVIRPGRKPVWAVVLDPMSGTVPFTLTAKLDNWQIQLHDVLFGDVWLCSGGNNMAYTMNMVTNVSTELSSLENYKNIRLLTIDNRQSSSPVLDFNRLKQAWTMPSRDSLISESQYSYFSALCWLYGKALSERLHYPIGLIASSVCNTAIETWSSPELVSKCGGKQNYFSSGSGRPSGLWNAMIHPLLNLTLYGAIWYQGESNAVGLSRNYNCSFPAMVEDWRKKFYEGTHQQTDRNFPFGFVQLCTNHKSADITYGFPDIRWQQTADYGFVPNLHLKKTFMAVSIDLPDVDSPYEPMHPRNKREIAERLVRGAMAVAYRQKGVLFQGPMPVSYTANMTNRILNLHFDTAQIEIRSNGSFEVCCSDQPKSFCPSSNIKTSFVPGREWVQAPIMSNDNNIIRLSLQACSSQHVVGLRYAWRETPCGYKKCAVYNAESGLPAAPYIRMGLVDDSLLHDIPQDQMHLI